MYLFCTTKKFNNEKKSIRSIKALFSRYYSYYYIFFYQIPVVQFATLLFDIDNNFIKIIQCNDVIIYIVDWLYLIYIGIYFISKPENISITL